MKNSLNTIAKAKYFREYKFPRSSRDKAIIQASESGCGFKIKYEQEWSTFLGQTEFENHIQQVRSL